MNYKDTDLAWLAGFLDGEGTIGIGRTNGKNYKHAYYRPYIQAPNTDDRPIKVMANIIESITGKEQSITINKSPNKQKNMYRIRIATQWELLMLLPMLMPYLTCKKEQAELTLSFVKRRFDRGVRHWYQYKEQDDLDYQRSLLLNKRGTSEEEKTAQIINFNKSREVN